MQIIGVAHYYWCHTNVIIGVATATLATPLPAPFEGDLTQSILPGGWLAMQLQWHF